MIKAGYDYQELVALVAKVNHRNAEIHTGQWIEGPDGQREVDVEVRGLIDGKPHFILIECKDWKRPVDITEIDNLESKHRDLGADTAIICSNSGFTKKALRKAERVGIDTVSALAAGNKLVRPMIQRELVAKSLSVDNYQMTLYPSEISNRDFPEQWDLRTLRYEGLPFANWLSKSTQLLQRHEGERKIVEMAAFKFETAFSLGDIPITLRGFRVEMWCSRTWISQTVREDVSLGYYNHITRRPTIPSQQFWSLGVIDNEAWQQMDIEGEPEEWSTPLDPGSFRLNFTAIRPIPPFQDEETPPIDELINERSTELE